MFSSTVQRELWLPRALNGAAVKLQIPSAWKDQSSGSYRILLRYNKETCDPISIAFKGDKSGDDWKQNSFYFTNPAFAGTKFLDGFREWTVAINANKKWIPSKSTDYYEGKLPPKPEKPKTPTTQRKATPKKNNNNAAEQKASTEEDEAAAKKKAEEEEKLKEEEERKAKLLASVDSFVTKYKQDKEDSSVKDNNTLSVTLNTIAQRQGGQIRGELLTLYNNKCTASGSSLKMLLEVAWIESTTSDQESEDSANYGTNNALLLTAELHTLFDLYYWTLSDNYEIMLSDELLNSNVDDDDNSAARIVALDGKKIQLPENNSAWPSLHHIQFHRLVALKLQDRKSVV